MSFLSQRDLMLEIPRSLVSGQSSVNKFGRNPDIDIGTEDVWDGGGTWVGPTAARIHALVSSSTDDAAAGTGARTVYVEGLNGSYAVATETVTMDGTTPVNTANSYIRIYRMYVVTAGSGLVNAGNITATAAVDGTVTAQISTGFSQTLMAIYTVPAGKTAYMTSYYVSCNAGNTAYVDCLLLVRPDISTATSPKQLKHHLNLSSTGTSYLRHEFAPYFRITEKSDIWVRATTTAANTDTSAGFDLILVTN